MFFKKVIVILFFILFITKIYALDGSLGFSAIKSKYIDVDINIEIPINVSNYSEGDRFTLRTPIFYSSKNQQVNMKAFYFNSNNKKIFANIEKDEFGNDIAVFDINKIDKSNYIFYIKGNVKSENKIILNKEIYDLSNTITDFNNFKLPSEKILSNSKEIISMADILKRNNNALSEIINITNWIHQNIEYDLNYANRVDDSLTVLHNKKGVCDEFSILEAAILRARGFPVKYISGVSNTTNKWESHAWLDVYVPNQGWIQVDPTYAEVAYVDSSHIILSESEDPTDIEDKISAIGSLNIEFGNKKITYNINQQKSYSEMGYNNLLNFDLSFEKDMRENSLFSIKNIVKNTTARPISILVMLKTNSDFELLYPNNSEKIIYLKPFEEKEFLYHYKLPDINVSGNNYKIYPFNLVSQINDISESVNIYPTKGLFEEAFFVSDPVFYFKDKDDFFINLNIFNYTSYEKDLNFNLDLNSKNILKEEKIIPPHKKLFFSKEIKNLKAGKLAFNISGDYMFSKYINIYPDQDISEDTNKESNVNLNKDFNILDSNVVHDYNKSYNNSSFRNSKNKFIPIILIVLFFVLILIFIISKPKKRDI